MLATRRAMPHPSHHPTPPRTRQTPKQKRKPQAPAAAPPRQLPRRHMRRRQSRAGAPSFARAANTTSTSPRSSTSAPAPWCARDPVPKTRPPPLELLAVRRFRRPTRRRPGPPGPVAGPEDQGVTCRATPAAAARLAQPGGGRLRQPPAQPHPGGDRARRRGCG